MVGESYGSVVADSTRNLEQHGVFTVAVLWITTVPPAVRGGIQSRKQVFSPPLCSPLPVCFLSPSWRGTEGVCFRFIGGLRKDCQEPNYLNSKPWSGWGASRHWFRASSPGAGERQAGGPCAKEPRLLSPTEGEWVSLFW